MPPAEPIRNESVLSHTDIVTDKKWSMSFPQTLGDESSSSKFMCRAMFVAFSTVFRYRKLLGEECFKTNYITEKLKIRSLSFDNKDSLTVSQHLRGASTALKDGVLEELALVISEKKDAVEALEVFSWKMHYDAYDNSPSAELTQGNGTPDAPYRQLAKMKYAGANSVKDQLVLLVRSIQVICQKVLQPLPDDVFVNLRMSYIPHTRPEYTVDGFRDSPTFYTLSEDCQTASIGQLRPGQHGCDLSCSSVFILDSYDAECTLKKYADKLADSLGYDRPNTLYTSFMSNETQNLSMLGGVGTDTTVEHARNSESDETDKLAEKVQNVQLKPKESPKKVDNVALKTRRKRGKAGTVAEEESSKVGSASVAETSKPTRFARVRSIIEGSPEKRSRHEK